MTNKLQTYTFMKERLDFILHVVTGIGVEAGTIRQTPKTSLKRRNHRTKLQQAVNEKTIKQLEKEIGKALITLLKEQDGEHLGEKV